MEKFIKENNLKDRFICTGFREDVLELIATMDILLVPNKNGVLGRQPIEAQAAGVIVIAQAGHSGKSRVVVHNETGYIVNNNDQYVLKIEQLLSEHKYKTVSKAAQKHAASNFSPKTNMRKIESIYMRCIKQ